MTRESIAGVGLALVLVTLAMGDFGARAQPSEPWTEHEVALGRLAVHEATWRERDTIAIVEARGHYSVETLRRMHPRALGEARERSRPWIHRLDATFAMPEEWPEDQIPWDSRGRALWQHTLETVRATLRRRRSVCIRRPDAWGSRTLDAARLARVYARGGREVCTGTSNAFVVFGGRP